MKPGGSLLTAKHAKWDHLSSMGTPRIGRGGGWRKRSFRATFVALVAFAFVVSQQMPAAADDDEAARPLHLAAAVVSSAGAHSMLRERPSTAARISNVFVRLSIHPWRDDVRALNSAL